ncbi:type IV/VI secretion system ImpK/VasF family protein [Desulfobotulus alkaliphilus]|uniref:Type IV/VI secretion system ImpK/VasF family protein n=1 Tax=Desulfobotulus alkaliphilus TaxID=622671 RepID=A0A562RC97_9BACT|nr:DotU family type IV/VI secretion system protein [Desulfobotulus alkaliphilus]TWI66671.1 type IV/VI secretion system ImpK/VasF family protein [Desulfobotulus alkaliphilus]
MNKSLWAEIYKVFRTRDRVFSPFRASVGEGGESFASEKENDPERSGLYTRIREPGPDDLVQARSAIREALENLREALSRELMERDVYYLLFPIVAHLDEGVQTRYMDPAISGGWPPLQRELFDTDAAGVVFYETLEDLLLKPQTLPAIFEVYYFCLSDGFNGRMVNNPSKRQEFMERLTNRIPVPEMSELSHVWERELTPVAEDRISPFWLYGGALSCLILFYFILSYLGSYWMEMNF